MDTKLFKKVFLHTPEVRASAPGRINVIGEHTDYNNGYVLPAAIHLRNHFLAARRTDRCVRIRAENFNQQDTFDLEEIRPSEQKRWANYVKGIFWALKEEGYDLEGIDAAVWGEVPLESGLSSSAALEVSVIKGLTELFGLALPQDRLAKLAQKAENEFVGVKCGLMDQFISVFARKDHALFLDCETLEFAFFPLNLEKAGLGILVYDTRVRRKLASSEYNKRRREATQALEALTKQGARSYKEATLEMLEAARKNMGAVPFKRARHVISENARVKQAAVALQADDFAALGSLLWQSHESLRDDYEVSCPELDLLYEMGKEFPGCLGARLVGAGFGGSGIALLQAESRQEFEKKLAAEAERRGFPKPEFLEVSIGDGATASILHGEGKD